MNQIKASQSLRFALFLTQTIFAGIGFSDVYKRQDRDRIERIYGAGFLDITDLNQLPVMLTNLISRHLPL